MTTTTAARLRHFIVKIGGAILDDDTIAKIFDIEVSLSFNVPSMFTLRFEDDDLELLGNNKVSLGDEVEIQLANDDETDSLAVVFTGEVTAIEPSYETGFRTVLIVRGYDFSHRLTHGTYIRTFQNSKDSDIVSTMAGEVGLTASVEATTTVYDYVMQYNQTNMAFLRQLARRNNYKFYIDTDKKLQFKKAATANGSEKALAWGERLLGFFPRMSISEQVTEVTVRGWDVATKAAVVGTSSTASYLQAIGGEQKGGSAYQTATSKTAKHYEVTHMALDQTQADALAQAILDELNADYIEAEGICIGNAALLPGMVVDISKVNSQFEGKYKLSTVRHIYSPDGYRTEFTVEGMRPYTIASLLGNSEKGKLTNQPVYGVVPAIVTQNADEENLHRVRVKYPWLSDDEESWWARVATPDAGPSRGMTFTPEIDDEVLVAFEHGDIGRPYVVGRVWNGSDAVPHTNTELVADGKVNLRVIKTRAGHVLTFDDTADAELISLVDKTGTNLIKIESSTNLITIDAKGGKVIFKLDGENGKLTITTDDAIEVEAGGTVDITSGAAMNLTAGGNLTLDAGTNTAEIKGGNVKLTASQAATVKGSTGATVDGGTSATIKGLSVAIN